jgi:hypothetical protein
MSNNGVNLIKELKTCIKLKLKNIVLGLQQATIAHSSFFSRRGRSKIYPQVSNRE